MHFVIFRKIIYRADVANDGNSDKKFYFGLANTFFKERYRNHIRYFKDENYENSTELAIISDNGNKVTSISASNNQ